MNINSKKSDKLNLNKYKWNLKEIYNSDISALDSLKNIEDTYYNNLSKKQNLNECNNILKDLEKIYVFFILLSSIDKYNMNNSNIINKIESLYLQISDFIEALDANVMISDNSILYNIENFQEKMSKSYYNLLFSDINLTYVEINNNKFLLTIENYNKILLYGKRNERIQIYNLYNEKIIDKVIKDIIYIIGFNVYNKNIIKQLNFSDNYNTLELEQTELFIYNNFKKNVDKFIKLYQDYIKLRLDILKVNELHPSDMTCELFENNEIIPYELGKEIILKSISELGFDFQNIVIKAFENNWIDVYKSDKKINGSFCYNAKHLHPYILINYDNGLEQLLELSHELGHAVQFYLSNINTDNKNGEYMEISTEIASVLNEILLLDELCKIWPQYSQSFKIKKIDRILQGIIRIMMELEFIENASSLINELVSEDDLNKLWKEINIKYYGSYFNELQFNKYDWIKIDFFKKNKIRIRYLVGFITSVNLINKSIFKTNNCYIDFLKSGYSEEIIEKFKLLNIDLENDSYIIESIYEIKKYIEEIRL